MGVWKASENRIKRGLYRTGNGFVVNLVFSVVDIEATINNL